MKDTRETGRESIGQPGEVAAMKVPPRSRWQVLLMEYELLDAYWTHLHQRIWAGGLVLVGLTMVGIAYLAVAMDPRLDQTLSVVGLVGAVAGLLTVGWWFLLRRLLSAQKVTEYRKREIERELGMRQELYLSFLRQSRRFGFGRTGSLVRQVAMGDDELETDLREFSHSAEAKPWFPRLMGEGLVWSLVPWLLIAAWVTLYVLKIE